MAVITEEKKKELDVFFAPKHPGAISVANYKGGVGKTTVVCLLGYYLAELTKEKVLIIDIDPQCSLSLAVGFDPEEVSKTELTIYNLVKPTKWPKIKKTNFENYVFKVPDTLSPEDLYIVRGSFFVEDLDIEITKSMVQYGEQKKHELFLYCKQMLNQFDEFKYILIDCPPNRMFLTQAMLQASSFYLPVTIPHEISIYGMPRLLRWVTKIGKDRPKLLGYVINAINRTGGLPGGKVYSQQAAESRLEKNIKHELDKLETTIIGDNPQVGVIPRLDAIARFLNERETKYSRLYFSQRTSGQPSIDECLRDITNEIIGRIGVYSAKA
ncbi:MAG: ParA family protein [Candidatus Heimdallarchaeota archaeon]